MIEYLPFLIVLAVWIHAFVDCVNTPEDQVRHLPKIVWLLIVVLFGAVLVGPLLWFLTGSPRRAPIVRSADRATDGGTPREQVRWIAPDDNPEFLRSLGEANRMKREGDQGDSPRG